jgi:hypothetical protein
MAGGTPANHATQKYEREPGRFPLIGGRFAGACSLSGSVGIYEESLLATLWLVGYKVMAGGTPANHATLVTGGANPA